MKQTMTKEEYVASRRTIFDKILFYSWMPFAIIFALIGIAVYNEQMDGVRFFALLEIPALLLTVICRGVILANKEADYISDYYDKYLKEQ